MPTFIIKIQKKYLYLLKNMKNTKLIIEKSKLRGKIKLSGAKNSALKLIAASILTDGDITLTNSPNKLIDMKIHLEMLKKLGKKYKIKNDILEIKKDREVETELRWEGPSIRNTLLILGALLTRKGRGKVPLPGGCSIGERKYDLHVMLLKKMGAKIWEKDGYIMGEAPMGLKGNEIILPIRSTGATENSILAACLAKGRTTIWGPHVRPEIIDLITFLKSMGAKIQVRGQESIIIEGVRYLHGTKHRVIPDNIEAMTYLIAALVTNSEIEILNFPYKNLEIPLIFLKESGANFLKGENGLIVKRGECFPIEISTGPYPGINSDMQPLFAAFAACAKGKSKIIDLRFPKRFNYIEEFKKLNVRAEVEKNILTIEGKTEIKGGKVIARDLRCGAALVVLGLTGKKRTTIFNAEQIQRGYEKIEDKLSKIGAKIQRVDE